MFGKKKTTKPRRDHSGKNLAQYGLFDIPSNLPMGGEQDSEGDSDLEAELAALSGGSTKPARKPERKPLPQSELDAMVADSMRDVPSDEEVDVDENDPELLGELMEITGDTEEVSQNPTAPQSPHASSSVVDILNGRLKNYETAETQAKAAGETSKARRYGRAIKTLKDLIKQANSGTEIVMDDSVPPEIGQAPSGAQPEAPLAPIRRAPTIPPTTTTNDNQDDVELPKTVEQNVGEIKKDIDVELLSMLNERQKEYKMAALRAKKAGDATTAVKFVKIAKQFDHVIEAVKNGQPVDLSQMPGPPTESAASSPREPPPAAATEENQIQKSGDIVTPGPSEAVPQDEEAVELITASSVGEALEQQLGFYREHEAKAKEDNNTSKARRYGRIIKQYEQAIKAQKAGKPVALEELPIPPGYAPFPVDGAVKRPKVTEDAPSVPEKPSPSRVSGNKISTSHQEKQVMILLAKQKQFKLAALTAKRKGELHEAKEFLRQAKGFDKLIEAARAGLPVDWASIPVSPEAKSQLDTEYDIVMAEECTENDDADADVLSRLENQLTKQLKMCLGTRDHHKAMGDVAGTNRFERLALNVTKDLDVVRLAKRTRSSVPKFHYETKDFSIVKSFTDLNDNDLELLIVRGINYTSTNPKEIDTYVKFEFPFPQETPHVDKTSTVRDTNNPEYNQTFVIPIQRNSRQCQRVFKRHGIKFELYSKGCYCCGGASDIFSCFSGLFRSDQLIGTVNVKLQPLETMCELHESFDLLEGRKKLGGKLEVRLRLRQPIVTQQIEQIHEKWLIIDQ